MKHTPRKRFGQHFLTAPETIEMIVAAIDPRPGETIVEIGPGQAAITEPLAVLASELHAIEFDRDLARVLRTRFATQDNVTIHEADVLAFDFATIGTDLRIVGNLPYNISTPLLFHLLGYRTLITDMHFMLQKEVVDRICAKPGSKDFGVNPVLYCSFPSLKDPTYDPGPDQIHTGEVVTFVPWDSFAQFTDSRWKKRGEEYNNFKQRLQDALLEQFFAAIPELKPMLEFVEFSTPASTAHFDRAVGGSIYGLAPLPARFAAKTLHLLAQAL